MMWLYVVCLLLLGTRSVWGAVSSLQLDLVAEFVTVDYLWDSNHSRALYQEQGLFVVANNLITGIKVSQSGDIFVAVPRWMSGVPASLNKLVSNPNGPGYVLSPWPSWEFNTLNQSGCLQYAQSFTIDSQNRMWIPDVGRTNFYDADASLVTNAPAALYVVDIDTGSVVLSYTFPDDVVPYNNSFVNDIVLDEVNSYAYFTNTWADGGIIVYNILQNTSHMFVSNNTERDASYNFCVNNICYGTDGIGASPSDGIALSADGTILYWSAVQGTGLYSIETKYLWNFSMTNEEFQARSQLLGDKSGCSDGLLMLPSGDLVYGDITNSQVGVVNALQDDTTSNSLDSYSFYLSGSSPSTLNWIDTFSADLACSTCFYLTSNKLNLFFNATMDFTGQSGANFRIYHATTSATSGDDDDQASLSPGAVAGIVLGGVAGLILLAWVVWRVGSGKAILGGKQEPLSKGIEATRNVLSSDRTTAP